MNHRDTETQRKRFRSPAVSVWFNRIMANFALLSRVRDRRLLLLTISKPRSPRREPQRHRGTERRRTNEKSGFAAALCIRVSLTASSRKKPAGAVLRLEYSHFSVPLCLCGSNESKFCVSAVQTSFFNRGSAASFLTKSLIFCACDLCASSTASSVCTRMASRRPTTAMGVRFFVRAS